LDQVDKSFCSSSSFDAANFELSANASPHPLFPTLSFLTPPHKQSAMAENFSTKEEARVGMNRKVQSRSKSMEERIVLFVSIFGFEH